MNDTWYFTLDLKNLIFQHTHTTPKKERAKGTPNPPSHFCGDFFRSRLCFQCVFCFVLFERCLGDPNAEIKEHTMLY